MKSFMIGHLHSCPLEVVADVIHSCFRVFLSSQFSQCFCLHLLLFSLIYLYFNICYFVHQWFLFPSGYSQWLYWLCVKGTDPCRYGDRELSLYKDWCEQLVPARQRWGGTALSVQVREIWKVCILLGVLLNILTQNCGAAVSPLPPVWWMHSTPMLKR